MRPEWEVRVPSILEGFFMNNFVFTSESVCAGHPDKICDQISDAIVDSVLSKDPYGRVAAEAVAGNNRLILVGEITTNADIDIKEIAKAEIKRLGYTQENLNFSDNSPIDYYIHQQSAEIAKGVNDEGAGDQGMMFGFATNESPNYMPLPITIAHSLAHAIDKARETKSIPYLRPDGKTQVTVEYKNNKPVKVSQVVLAVPHNESIALEEVREDLYHHIVIPILSKYGFTISKKSLVVNGTGVWHIGGPTSDAGLTGRKIVVDTYGGFARVGGGAFSGKDPTKVDRSGAYAARYLAKNIVAAELAERAEVSLAYFIGAKKPVMQEVETFGTEKKSPKIIKDFMYSLLDTSVRGILEGLNLRRPIYHDTAAYGHFGRDNFPWEKII